MLLYTSLLYSTTPIHCTPLPLHPPVMNTQRGPVSLLRVSLPRFADPDTPCAKYYYYYYHYCYRYYYYYYLVLLLLLLLLLLLCVYIYIYTHNNNNNNNNSNNTK